MERLSPGRGGVGSCATAPDPGGWATVAGWLGCCAPVRHVGGLILWAVSDVRSFVIAHRLSLASGRFRLPSAEDLDRVSVLNHVLAADTLAVEPRRWTPDPRRGELLAKLAVNSRAQAIVRAREAGFGHDQTP